MVVGALRLAFVRILKGVFFPLHGGCRMIIYSRASGGENDGRTAGCLKGLLFGIAPCFGEFDVEVAFEGRGDLGTYAC
jgi:hypothetical protein